MATALEQKLRALQEMGVDTPEGILQLLTGVGGEESQYPQGVMDFQGYDKMINQHYDEWSPSDLPNQMDSGLEGTQNLGLPNAQTASYTPGYTSGGLNSNWGTRKYNYMKDVYDVQTIDLMINDNAIHPKTHVITHRPDIGEDAYHVKKLASTDNSFYNQQLGAFFPYNKESGFTGGRTGDDRFNQNPYKNTGNPYSGLSYPWQTLIPLDFNNIS